jgi:hypothetical protein
MKRSRTPPTLEHKPKPKPKPEPKPEPKPKPIAPSRPPYESNQSSPVCPRARTPSVGKDGTPRQPQNYSTAPLCVQGLRAGSPPQGLWLPLLLAPTTRTLKLLVDGPRECIPAGPGTIVSPLERHAVEAGRRAPPGGLLLPCLLAPPTQGPD